MTKIERFFIRTRDTKLSAEQAEHYCIKRVYNAASEIGYMDIDDIELWTRNLYDRERGEAILVESALRFVNGNALYISSCIVFHTLESCNLYYIRNRDAYSSFVEAFHHLHN